MVELLRRRREHLDAQRTEAQELIERTLAQGVHPLFLIEEEYRLALLDAEAGFVDRFIEQITDPREGWAPMWAQAHHRPDDHNERNQA